MYDGHRIAVVVPAHNEGAHIANVILTMPDFVDLVVVIDDASTDDTARIAEDLQDPRTHVISLAQNQGVGGAILTGHAHVLKTDADVSVIMAGDGQMDPARLADLLGPITRGNVAFTKANRFFSMDSFEGMPWPRVVGNVLFSFLTKAASGYWNLFDPQNGYTAIHRSALERLPLDRIARRYEFENDLLIHLNILRVPAADVPIPARYGNEVSGIRMRAVVPRIVRQLVTGFWRRIFLKYVVNSFSPVAVMLFSGMAMLILGVAVGVFVAVKSLGPPEASAATVLLSVGPLLLGSHLLLYAWLLDIQDAAL